MKILTMGESMATFAPKEHGRLRYVTDFRLRLAGAESNFAIGLQKMGHEVYFVGRVGEDEFGQFIRRAIAAEEVRTDYLKAVADYPTGLMIKQTSAGNETTVTYYRQGSAASTMTPADITSSMMEGVGLFHVTGITPVLSESCEKTVLAAMDLADKAGAKISFDPNIRMKLWRDTDYRPLMKTLMARADFVLIGKDEGKVIFGTDEVEELKSLLFASSKTTHIAIKDGGNGATVLTREEEIHIPPYPCNCIDTVGAGDAFNAGFLAGILEGQPLSEAGLWGAVAGAKATESSGDIEGYLSKAELLAVLGKQQVIYR